jgi:hypothetical protein
VKFVVDKEALGQVSLLLLRFFSVSIISQLLSMLISHMGINNKFVGGLSSETYSHPIDMNLFKTFFPPNIVVEW